MSGEKDNNVAVRPFNILSLTVGNGVPLLVGAYAFTILYNRLPSMTNIPACNEFGFTFYLAGLLAYLCLMAWAQNKYSSCK